MKQFDAIIIGGGAAGLMCAITAGQRGKSVLLIEHTKRVGKKILMSGGGRCNFTNLHVHADNFLSANPHFCKSALEQYTQRDFIELVEKHGIAYYEKTLGQLFCADSAKQIVAMLLVECSAAQVQINTECHIKEVSVKEISVQKSGVEKIKAEESSAEKLYLLQTNQGIFSATNLVIATGGLSIPTMGATGFAYRVAEQFNLSVLPTRAALVPMTLSGQLKEMSGRLSGVALPVIVEVLEKSFAEKILFTHRGLSGPAVLQISNYWQTGGMLQINFLPDQNVFEMLAEAKCAQPNTLLKNVLNKYLPKALVLELEALFWPQYADRPLQHYSNKQLQGITDNLAQWRIKPSGTEGYRTAEVTLGGVDTKHFSSKTMECKSHSGLYFIGEALDVTGQLGGYNFQWAWSSAYVAGISV